jgi:hypothetical protein
MAVSTTLPARRSPSWRGDARKSPDIVASTAGDRTCPSYRWEPRNSSSVAALPLTEAAAARPLASPSATPWHRALHRRASIRPSSKYICYTESACCKSIFQVFQMFLSVTCVVYRCWKSRLGCCTCCNGYTRMFQAYVPNVSSVSHVCCRCFI